MNDFDVLIEFDRSLPIRPRRHLDATAPQRSVPSDDATSVGTRRSPSTATGACGTGVAMETGNVEEICMETVRNCWCFAKFGFHKSYNKKMTSCSRWVQKLGQNVILETHSPITNYSTRLWYTCSPTNTGPVNRDGGWGKLDNTKDILSCGGVCVIYMFNPLGQPSKVCQARISHALHCGGDHVYLTVHIELSINIYIYANS